MNFKPLNRPGWVWILAISVWAWPGVVWSKAYNVDGMVGQVNGQAIYTNVVLEPIQEQLAALGRELPRDVFRKRAAVLIASRLNGMVTDALIYGEAQRDLSEQERRGLAGAMAGQRENLLREYGQGSPALAQANLIQKTGLNLDQTLEQWRQTAVVERYMRQKLYPMVNVTRKDVKRYYLEHNDQFNPPATRTVCVIQVDSDEEAEHIRTLLDSGMPFTEAAADDVNLFRPDTGGLMGEMAGDQLFADPKVNAATLKLDAGQTAGPIPVADRLWFVHVQQINQPKGKPLMQMQVQIHLLLFEQQFREQSTRYRDRLFEQGSYNSIEKMTMTLLDITVDRYAQAAR